MSGTSRIRTSWSRSRAYVEAGSRVLLTNTFRANRLALEAARPGPPGRRDQPRWRRGRAARGRGTARVFASLGPSGKLLATGQIREGDLREAFAEQARALADAGADALVLETLPI